MPIDLYPSVAKVKRNNVFQNLPGFIQPSGDAEIEAMIAKSETDTTAQYEHLKNSFFILNDTLYQADEYIPVNGTIAVGTNCHVEILGNVIGDIETNTDNLIESTYVEIQDELDWIIATTSTAGYPKYIATRLLSCSLIHLGDISVDPTGDIAVHAYAEDTSYLGGWASWKKSIKKSEILSVYPTAKYMRVIFRRANNGNCSLSDITNYNVKVYNELTYYQIKKNDLDKGIITNIPVESGGISATGKPTNDPPSPYSRLRTTGFIKLEKNSAYRVTVNDGINVSVSLYPSTSININRTAFTKWFLNSMVFIATNNYARFTFAKAVTTDNIVPSDLSIFKIEKISITEDNYLIDSGFNKIPVGVFPIGTLKGIQSFCKYNNKYYSINGTNLYVQGEDFALESTTALALGHGNAFQLGHNGKAYASGWDDDSVYVVDLETKTIEETITLPVTGYTTVAVDDINEIMYIFQRTSYPDTEDYYNFVVYDYNNEQIISTKKITQKYGAMQSCDFVDGKIIALNGSAISSLQNGFRVYNTSGDIISEYFLNSYAGIEPEGVCFDRDKKELLMSFFESNVCTVCKIIS